MFCDGAFRRPALCLPLRLPAWLRAAFASGLTEHFKHRNVFVHGRPGLSVDDLTADPDFDWVAKWTQVRPQLAQAFNFLMMATVRAVSQSQIEQCAHLASSGTLSDD